MRHYERIFQHSDVDGVYTIVGINRTKRTIPTMKELCSTDYNWKMTEFQGQILHWISRQKIAFSTIFNILLSLLPLSSCIKCHIQFLEFLFKLLRCKLHIQKRSESSNPQKIGWFTTNIIYDFELFSFSDDKGLLGMYPKAKATAGIICKRSSWLVG